MAARAAWEATLYCGYNFAEIEADIQAMIRDQFPAEADVLLGLLEKFKNASKGFFMAVMYAGRGAGDSSPFTPEEGTMFESVAAFYRRKPHDPLTLGPINRRRFSTIGLTRVPYTGPAQLRPGVLFENPTGEICRVTAEPAPVGNYRYVDPAAGLLRWVDMGYKEIYCDVYDGMSTSLHSYDSRRLTFVYEIPPRSHSDEDGHETDCTICYQALIDDIVHGPVVACETKAAVANKIGCGHKFHHFCIRDWFATPPPKPPMCPKCRENVMRLVFAYPEPQPAEEAAGAAAAAAGGAGSGGAAENCEGGKCAIVGGARTRRHRNNRKNNRKTRSLPERSRKHRRSSHRKD